MKDPWASAVAVRPVQQQHQTQVPFWPQLQGTEFLASDWSATTVVNTTFATWIALQGMSADELQSPLPPPPTWDANNPGFGCRDSGQQDASLTWMECERKRIQRWCHAIRGILGSRSDTELGIPGTRSTIETLVTRTQFLATRHQYSCEQTRCQIVQVIAPSERLVGVWQINFRRIKFVRVKDLI